MSIEILNFKVTRRSITSDNVPELFELFGLHKFPIETAKVEFELKGVSTAVINAIRRVITDEMVGNYLQLADDSISPLTTDKFTDDFQWLDLRLNHIPLCYLISPEIIKNLKLSINITNTSSEQLFIHSGDLVVSGVELDYPLFNPTFNLFTVQPGKQVVLNNIFINSAIGKDFAAANIASRAGYKHLDIEEYPLSDTHSEDGIHNNFSGYKTSCMLSNPQHHKFHISIRATSTNVKAEVSAIFNDCYSNIINRLKIILASFENENSGIQFTILKLPNGVEKGVLIIPGETHTISNLIYKSLYTIAPDIVSASTIIYEDKAEIVVQHTLSVTKLMIDAIQHSLSIFYIIQKLTF